MLKSVTVLQDIRLWSLIIEELRDNNRINLTQLLNRNVWEYKNLLVDLYVWV